MFMKPSKCTGFIMGHTWHKYKMIYLSSLKKTQQSWTPEELWSCKIQYVPGRIDFKQPTCFDL